MGVGRDFSDTTNWQIPRELPDLRRVGIVALDTEENDEGLRADRGSGWPWRGGHVAGISVAWRADGEMHAIYIPLRHPDTDNFDPDRVFRWLKDLVASDVRIVTHNGIYDFGWLRAEGGVVMPPSDRLEETGALATMIDENQFSYSLNSLCGRYGLPGKDETLLRQAVEAAGFAKGRKEVNPQEHIWRLPARYVGPYAEADAFNTLLLFEKLNPILAKENIRSAYRLEIDLLPMVLEMRLRGIRIDQDAAEQARDFADKPRCRASEDFGTAWRAGRHGRDQRSQVEGKDLRAIRHPLSAHGERQSEFLGRQIRLDGHTSPLVAAADCDRQQIRPRRQHLPRRPHPGAPGRRSDLRRNQPASLRGGWHPLIPVLVLKSTAAADAIARRGARAADPARVPSGRGRAVVYGRLFPTGISLCGAPRRHPQLAGGKRSGQALPHGSRYRLSCTRQRDHRLAAEGCEERQLRQDLRCRGEEVCRDDRQTTREAQVIYTLYDQRLPFLLRLADAAQHEADRLGYTVLYDGARRHWDRWAPRVYSKGAGPCSLEEAQQRIRDPGHPWFHQRLQRVGIHTALNAQIQGDAARHTKLWMRAVWREGIVPLLQMHDGLELSVTTREQGELVARLACEAVELEVPMRADINYGRSWGDAKHSWEELHGLSRREPQPKLRQFNRKTAVLRVPRPRPTSISAPLSSLAGRSSSTTRFAPKTTPATNGSRPASARSAISIRRMAASR